LHKWTDYFEHTAASCMKHYESSSGYFFPLPPPSWEQLHVDTTWRRGGRCSSALMQAQKAPGCYKLKFKLIARFLLTWSLVLF